MFFIVEVPAYIIYDGLNEDLHSAIVYERLMDCQHTSNTPTRALMFLCLFLLGGWRINVVKPFVSHKILFGMLPHQKLQ